MGNRAVITFATMADGEYLTSYEDVANNCGIYLHWNGGRDSVEGFCKYCQIKGFRGGDYGLARMTQVIANFFGGTLSIGVDVVSRMDCDNGDNGVYVLDDRFNIIDRLFFEGKEQNGYGMAEMLESINEAQPVKDQLPKGYFNFIEVNTCDLKIGDQIYFEDALYEKIKVCRVMGVGDYGAIVNGQNVAGIPFVNHYGETVEEMRRNPNNYLRGKMYLVLMDEIEE